MLAHETGHRAASIRQLRWSAQTADKIGFGHTTPLTAPAVAALDAAQKADRAIGDAWIFPAPRDGSKPVSRRTALHWFERACEAAKLPPMDRLGWHALRRQFASELKHAPLRDLAYLGGWKSPQTVLTVYQQPDEATQREALAQRRELGTEAVSGAK